jgi:hypothetical protein
MAVYTVPFDNLSVTNDSDQDIWELVGPADAAVKLHHFELYSATTTDERVRLRMVRRSTTGSGGTGATEVSTDGVSEASGGGVAVSQLVTTPGTVGDILLSWYWSQLSPLVYLPTPETRFVIPPSGRICLNLETAVASTRNWSGFVVYEVIG